jgi:hypothetical protein
VSQERWGGASAAGVRGIWSVIVALVVAILATVGLNRRRLPVLRDTVDAGLNASVLPMMTVASLVGFGAVIAAVPAFGAIRDSILAIRRWPLLGLAISTNVLAGLTGSASGGLTIALDALAGTYTRIAAASNMDPALMHRVAVLGAGTLDSLPHNGGRDAAGPVRRDPPGKLPRRRDGGDRRRRAGPGRGGGARLDRRLVLSPCAVERVHERNARASASAMNSRTCGYTVPRQRRPLKTP